MPRTARNPARTSRPPRAANRVLGCWSFPLAAHQEVVWVAEARAGYRSRSPSLCVPQKRLRPGAFGPGAIDVTTCAVEWYVT